MYTVYFPSTWDVCKRSSQSFGLLSTLQFGQQLFSCFTSSLSWWTSAEQLSSPPVPPPPPPVGLFFRWHHGQQICSFCLRSRSLTISAWQLSIPPSQSKAPLQSYKQDAVRGGPRDVISIRIEFYNSIVRFLCHSTAFLFLQWIVCQKVTGTRKNQTDRIFNADK